jgi:hypothetical protein
MSGRNTPEISVGISVGDAEPLHRQAPPTPPPSAIASTASRADALLGWLKHQPRRVRVAAGVIAFLFVINLLGGIANPWFLYPSIPLGLYIYLHYRRGQRPTDAERDRMHRRAGPES